MLLYRQGSFSSKNLFNSSVDPKPLAFELWAPTDCGMNTDITDWRSKMGYFLTFHGLEHISSSAARQRFVMWIWLFLSSKQNFSSFQMTPFVALYDPLKAKNNRNYFFSKILNFYRIFLMKILNFIFLMAIILSLWNIIWTLTTFRTTHWWFLLRY